MLKPKEYKLEETNAAKLGSNEDRATKKKTLLQRNLPGKELDKKLELKFGVLKNLKLLPGPKTYMDLSTLVTLTLF